MQWQGGKLVSAEIGSEKGGSPRVRYGEKTATLRIEPGRSVRVNAELAVSARH